MVKSAASGSDSPLRRPEPVAILGGTFDPVHHGHLRMAVAVADALALSCVRLMPAGCPPHRPPSVAAARHRLAMARLAAAGVERLSVDDRELRRSGPSYSVETLTQLRAAVGAAPLVWILGADAFARLATWRRWRDVLPLAHIAVYARPGSAVRPADAALRAEYARRVCRDRRAWRSTAGGRIVPVSGPQWDISATDIRAKLAQGETVRGLLPDAVLDYIRAQRVYARRRR